MALGVPILKHIKVCQMDVKILKKGIETNQTAPGNEQSDQSLHRSL